MKLPPTLCPSQAHCRRVERASIDEAYLDLTEEAAKLCQEAEAGRAEDVADAPETDLQASLGRTRGAVYVASPFNNAHSLVVFPTNAMRLFFFCEPHGESSPCHAATGMKPAFVNVPP